MRDEDNRGGSNLIDGSNRGPLSYGEARLLEAQHKNRSTDGQSPGQFEERNLRALGVDAKMKRPKLGSSPWVKDPSNQ